MTTTFLTQGVADRATTALLAAGIPVRAGWVPVRVREERHDERPVTVIRFQSEGYCLGGAHLSVVVDPCDTLLGYTCLTLQRPGVLPSTAAVREIALMFLSSLDSEYTAELRELWIAQHNEAVIGADGTQHVVSGMKVKTRHSSGLYAWVVVGPDGHVLTCERDIAWDAGAGRRATQMWLHDAWVCVHDGLGSQPDPPYARV
jgi:hypothetical protein